MALPRFELQNVQGWCTGLSGHHHSDETKVATDSFDKDVLHRAESEVATESFDKDVLHRAETEVATDTASTESFLY